MSQLASASRKDAATATLEQRRSRKRNEVELWRRT